MAHFPSLPERLAAALDTDRRVIGLIEKHFLNKELRQSAAPRFHDKELSEQDATPVNQPPEVYFGSQLVPPELIVLHGDLLTQLRIYRINGDLEGLSDKVVVVNPANGRLICNNMLNSGGTGDEERLCYTSTLIGSLYCSKYPWQNWLDQTEVNDHCAVWAKRVWVFRNSLEEGVKDLPEDECFATSAISVPLPLDVPTEDGDFVTQEGYDTYFRRITMIFRLVKKYEKSILYLSPFGISKPCSIAPSIVAHTMLVCLFQPEFQGYFEKVVFVIRGDRMYSIFKASIQEVIDASTSITPDSLDQPMSADQNSTDDPRDWMRRRWQYLRSVLLRLSHHGVKT